MHDRRTLVAGLIGLTATLTAVEAQDFSSGHLVVTPPTSVVTCEAATVTWDWTGDSTEEVGQSVSIAVESADDSSISRRSAFQPSASRLTRQRRSMPRSKMIGASKRGTPANLAGAASIDMTDGSWTWNSVGLEPGSYRFVVNAVGMGITSYSSKFTVEQGPDTSCVYDSASSSSSESSDDSSSSSSSSSPAPASSSTSSPPSSSTNPISSASPASTASSALSSSAANSASSSSTQHDAASASSQSGAMSGGKIAAAVLLPLLAIVGLIGFFCFRKRRDTEKGALHGDSHGSGGDGSFTEKVLAAVGTRGGKRIKHKREISAPMHPVHAAGLAMHEHAVASEMRRTHDKDPISPPPEHWVAFNNGGEDAQAITPRNLEDIVNRENARRSQDDDATNKEDGATGLGLYQQGKNRQYDDEIYLPFSHLSTINETPSSNPSRAPSAEIVVVTSKPSAAEPASQHQTTVNMDESKPEALARSASSGSMFSVRRKPAPVVTTSMIEDVSPYSTNLRPNSQGSTSTRVLLPGPDQHSNEEHAGREMIASVTDSERDPPTPSGSINSAHGPFSDANEVPVLSPADANAVSRWSASNVSDEPSQSEMAATETTETDAETLKSPRPAFMADERNARTSRSSEQFPSSVHSVDAPSTYMTAGRPSCTSPTTEGLHRRSGSTERNSPSAFTDLCLPSTTTEGDNKKAFKLSVGLDEKDQGFRLSF